MKHTSMAAGAVLAVVASALLIGCEQATNGDGDRHGSGEKTTQEKLVGGTWVELSRTVDGRVINQKTEFTFHSDGTFTAQYAIDPARTVPAEGTWSVSLATLTWRLSRVTVDGIERDVSALPGNVSETRTITTLTATSLCLFDQDASESKLASVCYAKQ